MPLRLARGAVTDILQHRGRRILSAANYLDLLNAAIALILIGVLVLVGVSVSWNIPIMIVSALAVAAFYQSVIAAQVAAVDFHEVHTRQ